MDKEKSKVNLISWIKKTPSRLFKSSRKKNRLNLFIDQAPSQPDRSKSCPCQQQTSKTSYAFDNLAYGSFVNNKH